MLPPRLGQTTPLLLIALASALTGCSVFGGKASSPHGLKAPAPAPAEPEEDDGDSNPILGDKPEATAAVRGILAKYCEACHGDPAAAQGGVAEITDLASMVTRGLVVAAEPDRSSLLTQIETGKMPTEGDAPAPEEVQALRDWIAGLPVINEYPDKREPLLLDAVYEAAARDLLTLEKADRVNIRYVDLSHLYNAGVPGADLMRLRHAIDKVANSLSTVAKLKVPEAANSGKTLVRLDMRDYAWTADAWDRLARKSPYTVTPEATKFIGILREDTGAQTPILRADWFVANATKAPDYYRFLSLPLKFEDFQKAVGVDLQGDIVANKVVRAGYKNSGISEQNRIIERHATKTGYLWRSYEFGTSFGQQDVLANPLGPVIVRAADDDSGTTPLPAFQTHAFDEDGGEILFTLPNKMLAYYVIGKDKNRLDQAPSSTKPGAPKVISVGITCMNCHKAGLIDRADETREAVTAQTGFDLDEAEVERVLAIYVERSKFTKVIDADSKVVRDALTEIGVNFDDKDPIADANRRLQKDLTIEEVAAELWVTKDAAQAALAAGQPEPAGATPQFQPPQQQDQRSPTAVENGVITRAQFEQRFTKLNEGLHGTP
jgi:hypothetical protein